MPNHPSVERRLAAILAADIVSYSRLMEADEVGTLIALKAVRRELVDPIISRHNGRIVKTTGDGFLGEFASVVTAVSCAIAIQLGMVLRNANVPEDRRIVFRIGINVGDVIIENGDIFGDGVNIAARLEAICEPGGLCISRTANDQIRDKLPLPFVDRGEQALKNIARAVGVYQLAPAEIAALQEEERTVRADQTAPSPGPTEHRRGERETRPSLAVLPFENLSRAAELEDFCDGLVEDTITALSRFRWINVVSRNSSFAQKGRAADIRQIARDLGASFILEGSVRKSDRRIRITAQLIDGASGNHIWAERYDRDYSALFDLQDEVTRDIVASLEYVLWTALVRANSHADANASKRSLLLTAGWHVVECTHADNRAAIACANAVLKENPRSVAAYQYIVNAYIAELYLGWTESAQADIESLLEAAGRAVALSPADSLSLGLYGGGLALSGDHDGALACVRRATTLNPNSVNVLGPCGIVTSLAGEAKEANEMIERMLRLTPAHYYRAGFLTTMSINYLRLGEPERGAPLTSEALKLKPDAPSCHLVHAEILRSTGRSDTAKASVAKAYQLRPDLNETLVRAIFPYRDRSIPDRIVTLLGMN